ncbi:MAG: RICIN domain-containing protein [Lewinellaceae bacterium]|nr:RICIN domain-containing protein [Lewinellaceae bacterium]
MKKQKKYFGQACKNGFLSVLTVCLSGTFLPAQGTIQPFVSGDAQHYYNIPVPASGYIFLELKGADGGDSRDTKRNGGEGAKVTVWLTIGSGQKEVPPGSTLRLIPGQRGGSTNDFGKGNGYGSGGGGTAVAFKGPNAADSWQLLAVAGGGGGSGSSYSGRPGTNTTDGTNGQGANGYGNDNKGTNGKAAIYTSYDAGEGAGAFSGGGDDDGKAGMQNGAPVGGDGGHEDGNGPSSGGGFGFGGGGAGYNRTVIGTQLQFFAGGGGGGYSGGGAGSTNGGGGGGGSYANPDWVILPQMTSYSATDNPKDGYVRYSFTDASPFDAITLAKDKTKCIDDYAAQTGNGTNIQLYHCHEHPAQQWVIDGPGIKLFKDLSKCIDLSGGATTNSTNIQLWDCTAGNKNQVWIYDVAYQAIRSGVDFNKCLDLDHGNTADGTNIRIWDCNNTDSQKWLKAGIPSAMPTGTKNSIRLAQHADKCVDITQGSILNGTNIQLYDCNGTPAQQFTFEDRAIKLIQMTPNKCIDLNQSQTGNGANIQLYDCNGTKAQQWIYDGFSKAFRSAIDINKCLDVDHSNTANGTNIQLWDCNGSDAQQFLIGQ